MIVSISPTLMTSLLDYDECFINPNSLMIRLQISSSSMKTMPEPQLKQILWGELEARTECQYHTKTSFISIFKYLFCKNKRIKFMHFSSEFLWPLLSLHDGSRWITWIFTFYSKYPSRRRINQLSSFISFKLPAAPSKVS